MLSASDILERISSLATELKLANLQPQIAACHNLLQTRNGIDVAVLGRFKAGKSSFLNHLVGRDVLPISVVPLTAVVTRLRYGETERAEVSFLNGTTKEIPLGEIGRYVGEHENPNNEKQVAAVDVGLPELKTLAPLQFVDTPGLGSALIHNTEVALNWLPNVGAALVAVSSDAPLSERDLALLQVLRRHTPKIVLLLTKADLLTESQRAEVRVFVATQLRQKWEGGLPVFFYSIKPELPGMKPALLKELLEPLLQHRGEASEQIIRHKLASLVSQTLNYLRVALAAATQAESARQALRERLDDECQHFGLFREELQVMAREWSAKALDQSLERLRPTQRILQAKVTAELRAQWAGWPLRLPPLLDAWRERLRVFLHRELSGVSRDQQAMFCEPLEQIRQHLTRSLRAFHDRLAAHVQAALGLTLTPCEFALEIREPSAPRVDVAYAFDAAFSTVGWLIPLTFFRNPIERVLLRKTRYEVEKNLSRLAVLWRDRVAASIKESARQAEQQSLEELNALENLLAQTRSGEMELRATIAELEAAHRFGKDDPLQSTNNHPVETENRTRL